MSGGGGVWRNMVEYGGKFLGTLNVLTVQIYIYIYSKVGWSKCWIRCGRL